MNDIKCPNCHKVFKVDEAGFADILKQVRDHQFDEELNKRLALAEREKADAVRLAEANIKNAAMENIAKKEKELIELNARKDREIAALINTKETEMARMKSQIDNAAMQQKLSVTEAVLNIEKERDEMAHALRNKELEANLLEKSLIEKFQSELRAKDEIIRIKNEEIDWRKDMKLKLSTKMIGETLEQHCETEFNKLRATAFQKAYFEKDNDARSGSKGDYIYRETDDAGIDIIFNGSGTVYVTGYTFTTLTNSDYISIKYNSNGVQQWIKTYNGTGNSTDKSNSIGLDAADNVYITGYSIGNGSSFDFATIKYNSSGTQQWVQRYNGPGNLTDAANDMFTDASGNCYVTGNSFGSSSFSDYAVIKYNSSGSQQWVQRYNGPANDYDYSGNINVDASGNVYVIGNSEGIGTMRDFATIKYSQTTGIEPIKGTIPDKFNLSQNYPNPFNPKTNIEFSLPVRGNVKISIFDLLGKEVSVLVNDFMKAGTYKTDFDASALSSGTYFYRIETEGFTDTKKMILIK